VALLWPTDEDRVRAAIRGVRDAARQRHAEGVMAAVSPGFRGPGNMTRGSLDHTLRHALRQRAPGETELDVEATRVDVTTPGLRATAEVTLSVRVRRDAHAPWGDPLAGTPWGGPWATSWVVEEGTWRLESAWLLGGRDKKP
jgi:hypothetical protein